MGDYYGFESRRLIGTQQEYVTKQSNEPYLQVLVKLIPVEVVSLYVTLNGIIKTSSKNFELLSWVIVIVGMICTWQYLLRLVKAENKQIILSIIGFLVWVFALGGPFEHYAWYEPVYGAVLLPIFTFFIPILKSKSIN